MDCHTIVLAKLLVLLFLSAVHPLYQGDTIRTDQSALLEFKKGLIADPRNALGNWSEKNYVCEWDGVECGMDPVRVTRLELGGKSLVGTISPFLSNLSHLILLELSDNSLQGSIPSELGSLSRLEVLALKLNRLQGRIPESFGMLAKLRFIDLSYNQLHGRLPDVTLLYNCSKLNYVDLSTNMFTGSIPGQIGDHLPFLQNFLIYSNQLFGTIPVSLTNSTILEEIDIEDNFFTGILPSEIFMRMSSLKRLHLSFNNFSSYDQNTNLVPFFNAISNLTHLEELEVAGNNLGGELPSTIGLLSVNISEIDLNDNLIQGMIPSNFSKLYNLTWLDLSNNRLHGTIPLELVLLPKLQRLWLSNNSLSGEIPAPPRVLTNIGLLDLSRNKLVGSIPKALANLTQLRKLILCENLLSESIPSSLGSIQLELLDLSHNNLTGTIPAEVARLSSMAFYFNLSDNLLQGKIPMELGQMNKVKEIDLSSNSFSGSIPSSMGSCEMVELVNFSHNLLQGRIPESLGSLQNIELIDLSNNLLSGEIPDSLQHCTNLRLFDLAFNNFSGPLPQGGVFSLLTLEWIRGNHFCGSLPGIPSCHYKKRSMLHSHKGLMMLIFVVAVSAFLITVICGVLYLISRKWINRRPDGDPSKPSFNFSSNHPRITYRELVEATDGFENSRLIGSGSFGRVYKGVLGDGTLVAIKVLQLQSGNSTKSFNRECQVLKTIRHRNLMRIITTCSLPDFKALVLPFMANGSLESHLYPQAERADSSQLSLLERVNICSDIAEGLAYLHHHSPVKVIHCDLKPSNILLNDDMTALVSDFGISRLVMTLEGGNTANESTANVLCGSIGYVAPEYGYGQNASTKGDVYSFGILVLEAVTRKRPTHDMFGEGLCLQKWVRKYYKSQLENVVDSSLVREICDHSLEVRNMWEVAILELLELGILCSHENPSERPTMLDAADDLDRLKRYLGGDTTATFTSSIGVSSSSTTADYWYDGDPCTKTSKSAWC